MSWRLLLVCVILGNLLLLGSHPHAGHAVLWCVPAFNLVRAVWHAVHPLSYEVVLGGPAAPSWVAAPGAAELEADRLPGAGWPPRPAATSRG